MCRRRSWRRRSRLGKWSSARWRSPVGRGRGRRARIEPLSDTRFKVQLTASRELRDKLERARDLMSHANPSGDLATVVERALDLLLVKLEKERLGKVTRSRPTRPKRADGPRAPRARTAIPRAVRREVFERDGEQCTFRDDQGRQCPARSHLELDHAHPHALGGPDVTANLRVRCRAHNRLHAEAVFGRAHLDAAIDFRQRKSHDLALRGLVNMGFPKADAQRALDSIAHRREAPSAALPVQDLLREALAALT
jgi:5-methylcytosine-specific restriction endonuclease McrA